ncbi:MAG: IS5 family transposase [Elusimicrobia bacterium]|nr:IS5 family transposase [Candidatus Obscuribacterium magneticum]
MYKPKDRETLPLFSEIFPFGGRLNPTNRWLKLSKIMPWGELEEVYRKYFSDRMGRPAKDSRLIMGLLVAKHMKGVSDEAAVEEFMESPYIQAFCGYDGFVTDEAVIDPSLLSHSRKRLGKEFFEKFEKEILSVLIQRKVIRPKDHMLDATIVPANIEYPTDVKLVNRCREWLVKTIRGLRRQLNIKEKIRTHVRKARGVYVNFQRKRKRAKRFIRRTQKKMLQFAGRNLRQLKALLKKYGDELTALQRRVIKERLKVLETIFKQQWAMWKAKSHQMKDRIVSLHLPHIRPMVRGKDGRDVEFGPKALLSWVDGFCFLDYFSFDAYNEALHAGRSLRKYKERFGHLPAVSIGDGIFGNRANRRKLGRLGVLNAFKPLGRPSTSDKGHRAWMKKKQRLRNGHMEGIIGHAKNRFGLDRIRYRIENGELIWTMMALMGMNLSTALKRI